MSIINSVKEEISRSPIASISGAVGVLIAGVSLLIAWIQFQAQSVAGSPTASVSGQSAGVNISNLLLLVAYFVAITATTAIILRAAARKHDLTAFFASIPVVALTNFSTILVVYLAPPRQFDQAAFTSAHDLVFYGAFAIVVTFCGSAVMRDLIAATSSVSSDASPSYTGVGSQPSGWLLFVIIVMVVWGKLVFAGQVRLTKTLLPEVTHPIEVAPKMGTPGRDEGAK